MQWQVEILLFPKFQTCRLQESNRFCRIGKLHAFINAWWIWCGQAQQFVFLGLIATVVKFALTDG